MWDRRSEYLENHDGDTIKMTLDQGFGDTKLVDIRLLGVFAPELKQVGGIECQAFVQEWFKAHAVKGTRWGFVTTTARMKITDREQKTLDRYVGIVTSLDGTENLNLAIMQFIAANKYSSGIGS